MADTTKLQLPLLSASQSQKHVTVNEALRRLDAIIQASVVSATTTAQPTTPNDGDLYILPVGKTGDDWGSMTELAFAYYVDGAWSQITPKKGWRAYIQDTDATVAYDLTAWNAISGASYAEKTFSGRKDGAGAGVLEEMTGAEARANLDMETTDDVEFARLQCGNDAFTDSNVILQVTGNDNTNPVDGDVHIRKEATTGFPVLTLTATTTSATSSGFSIQRRSRGTFGSEADVADGDWLGGFSFRAYANSGWQQRALVNAVVNGTVTGSTVPTDLAFWTGSTGVTERVRIYSDGGAVFGSPTGGNKGVGTINCKAAYDDNALLSCFVFDQALDGRINLQKWDDKVPNTKTQPLFDWEEFLENDTRKGHEGEKHKQIRLVEKEPGIESERLHEPLRKFQARIGTKYDPLDIEKYAQHWKDKRHLTSMPSEINFGPDSTLSVGEWIQRAVETLEIQAIHIDKLNERLKALEQIQKS